MATTRIDVEGYTYLHDSGSTDLEFTKYTGTETDVITPIVEVLDVVTITVVPNPIDAHVTLTAAGYNQEENSITVPRGTEVTYQVTKTGYHSSELYTITATATQTLYPPALIPYDYTLTISPKPADATVTLTAAGYTQEGNHITVPYGTQVLYEVSKIAYSTSRGLIKIENNVTLQINLVKAGSAAKFMNYGTCVVCFQIIGTRVFDLEYVYEAYSEHYDYGNSLITGDYDEYIDCGGLDG